MRLPAHLVTFLKGLFWRQAFLLSLEAEHPRKMVEDGCRARRLRRLACDRRIQAMHALYMLSFVMCAGDQCQMAIIGENSNNERKRED